MHCYRWLPKLLYVLPLAFVLTLGPSALANTTEHRGKLKTGLSKARITGITWKSTDLPILVKTSSAPAKPSARPTPKPARKATPVPSPSPSPTQALAEVKMFAVLEGTYTREEWSLVYETQKVDTRKGTFRVEIPLSGNRTEFDLVAVGPKGNLERETMAIEFEEFGDAQRDPTAGPRKKFNWNLGLGFSYILYSDDRGDPNSPDLTSVNELALTVKASANYWLKYGVWDLGVSSYATVLPIFSSGQARASSSATAETLSKPKINFLGVNARVGYKVGAVKAPWSLTIAAGMYFTTMYQTTKFSSSGQGFGFTNMAGPQLYPTLRKELDGGRFWSAYLKFSPVSQNFGLQSLSSHELAAGGAYGIPMGKSKTPLAITGDFSRAQLKLFTDRGTTTTLDDTTVSIKVTTITLGVSYAL